MTGWNRSRICPLLLLIGLMAGMSKQSVGQARDTLATAYADTLPSKSGYSDLAVTGGVNTVDADLKSDDEVKATWTSIDFSEQTLGWYYNFKRGMKRKYRIAIGTDYMFLNQFANFSFSDKQASSGIYRFFGTWDAFRTDGGARGSFLVKIENRHNIGPGVIPRNLGYEAGSATSTASFKDFEWGLTNFYWRQLFKGTDYQIVLGIMDPGDWLDLFPLLNPFKYYLNEAFFNSPTMALPNQGMGFAFEASPVSKVYVAGGIHDANGQPQNWITENMNSFFNVGEYFKWIELGWRLGSYVTGETIHITYWHQDAREAEGLEESEGWNFSASTTINNTYIPFIRAGIATGNAPVMRRLIQAGIGTKILSHDYFGVGFHWGGPSDKSRRDQTGLEVFYAFQITQHFNITPDIQWTFNPSFAEDKKSVAIYSAVRVRYAM